MKKLVLVLGLVAVYAFAISSVSAKVITVEKSKISVISDVNDNTSDTLKKEDKKKDAKTTSATSVKKAPAKGCGGTTEAKPACSESAKKSCAASEKAQEKKACCGTK